MYRHPLFISWTLLLIIIATLHILALEFYLYWMYSWFDIMMHFLGGIFIALSTLWFFFQSGYVRFGQSTRNVILVTGSSIIIIGIGWEIFEILTGLSIGDNFVQDTITDLSMDVLGASVAAFIFIKIYLTENESVKNKENEQQQ